DEALRLYQQVLEVSRRVRGEEHPSTLLLEDNVAISLQGLGRMDEALQLHVRVVDARRRVLGEGHPQTIWSIPWLWGDIRGLASAPEGGARAVELVQGIIQSAPHSGAAWTALGMAQYEAADWSSAIESLEKSMEVRKAGSSIDWFLLSMAHARLGNADAARKWYDQAVQWMDKNQPNNASLREFRAPAEELLKIVDEKPSTKSESK
ncbi:MAG: tetratricopeptide repeat protein, partial [Acidobacteria bacterium]|nr:tetratricopeptide repeat protein [Acidobacteriota bacterium]